MFIGNNIFYHQDTKNTKKHYFNYRHSSERVCLRMWNSIASLRAKRSNLIVNMQNSDCFVTAFLAKTILSDRLESWNRDVIFWIIKLQDSPLNSNNNLGSVLLGAIGCENC
jgi:hypothetical protein